MAALHYPFEGAPDWGTTLAVAPGVLWLRMPLPFALDHINLWLLRDGDGWTVVDTGIAGTVTQSHWERIFAESLEGRPVRRLLVTHYHPDHVGQAAWLTERWGVEMWMSQAEFLTAHLVRSNLGAGDRAELARFFGRHGLDAERQAAFTARGNTYAKGVPALPTAFRRMVAGEVIAIDGRGWEVIVAEGHAPEHVSLHCAELGVLISGDQVLPRISTNVSVWHHEPEADPLGQYLDSLGRFRALPEETLVLPSHGRVFRGLHRRLDSLAAHHEERLANVLTACGDAPVSACELLTRLFHRELDLHQLMFAMGESIAHLNHLRAQGALVREEDATGCHRFARPV